jgi:hypothetical protein
MVHYKLVSEQFGNGVRYKLVSEQFGNEDVTSWY